MLAVHRHVKPLKHGPNKRKREREREKEGESGREREREKTNRTKGNRLNNNGTSRHEPCSSS